MAWAVETLNATVDKELEALPADMRARFVRISNLIAHKRERGSNVELLHKKWFSDPEYRTAYDKLGPEFEIARAVILARKGAGLTQQQLAQRMKNHPVGCCSLGGRAFLSVHQHADAACAGHRYTSQDKLRSRPAPRDREIAAVRRWAAQDGSFFGLSEPAISPQVYTTHAGLRYPAYTPTSSTVSAK